MMNDGVAELACLDRLRSRDINGKNKEEDKRKMNNYEEDEEEDEEEEEEEEDEDDDEDEDQDNDDDERKMWGSDKKVKKSKASTALLENEKRRKLPINLEKEDVEKAKHKGEKRIHGGDDKTKYRKASPTTFERGKNKKSSSHGRGHKIQSGGHDKDKRRSTLLPLNKNKDSLKEKSRKKPTTHSAEKKFHSHDHHKDKRKITLLPLDKNKDSLKEKSRKMPNTHSSEKKFHRRDHHKDKRKSMHTNSKYFEKKEILSSHNGENKIRSNDYVEHKGRSKPHPFNNNEMKKKNTPLDLSKDNKTQMMIDSKKENKRKKTTDIFDKRKKMRSEEKDEKAWSGERWKTKNTMQGYNKEQKNVPIAFIKLVFNNNFKEFLLMPPVVAPKFNDLTNRHVNLEDSEGKFSEVRLSMVDGSLAFYEGWNNFVSDHSIKMGDILLFEYTAKSHFSVRVFGMDSCERVSFSVERQGGKKQKGCHAPDETVNIAKSMNAVSGARRVAGNSKEDPKRVVSWLEHGSSIALYDLANGKHTANDIFQTCTKGTRNSELILITDDEAPLTQENEDTKKLKTLHADSETHCVTANTEEDPKGVVIGALLGPSVALDNMEGTLAIGECKTNCISSICSTEKTIRSEIIPVVDTAPLAQEYDDALELTAFPLHIEDTSMVKESEPEIATSAKCTKIQDSDEGLRRKQEGNTVQLECTTAVGKCPNNRKMNTNGNVFNKYEAPGGSPSLEKWKKPTVSGRTALDVTGQMKPEKLLKTEDKLVGNCSSMGVNYFEQSLQRSGRAALDGTGLITPEKRLKTAPEKRLKTDVKLVGNCSATGVNPVEQSSRGYAGTHSCVQQTPGKRSKSVHIKTEIDLLVNGKGPIAQQTQMEQFEPMGSISCRQQLNNISVSADHAEHHSFNQEDRKASHHLTPAVLQPVKVEDLELDDHSVLKTNLQFCIPSTTQTWLELPSSLSNAHRRKGRLDRNVVMLKDTMKRLWPVFYHENSFFVGFTQGWKPFVAANNLQTGDICMLLKDPDEDELVYHVQITRK